MNALQKLENNMEEGKLNFNLREVSNGWVLEVSNSDDGAEFIFTRPNQALTMIKKILNETFDPFSDGE